MIHLGTHKIERNDPCWCGSGRKYKACHMRFDDKLRKYQLAGAIVPDHSLLKTQVHVDGIKKSAEINMACLDAVAKEIGAGMPTEDIDRIVYETTVNMGGIPAPLHYEGFPKSVCTSINEEVCHGIPDNRHILKDGDIINVDCSTILNGYFSDSSRMYCIGNVSDEKREYNKEVRKAVLKKLRVREKEARKVARDIAKAERRKDVRDRSKINATVTPY